MPIRVHWSCCLLVAGILLSPSGNAIADPCPTPAGVPAPPTFLEVAIDAAVLEPAGGEFIYPEVGIVETGGLLRIVNLGTVSHRLISDDGLLDTGVLDPPLPGADEGGASCFSMSATNTWFALTCTLHPGSEELSFVIVDDTPASAPDSDLEAPRASLSRTGAHPARGADRFQYAIPSPGGHVELAIYDADGRRLRTLENRHRPPGMYDVEWNGKTDSGTRASAGLYFISLRFDDMYITQKGILLR